MKSIRLGVAALSLVSLAHAQTPAVNLGGVVNTGSYASGGVAPGSIVSIFGTNLATQVAEAGAIPLPTALSNVKSVTFNDILAPLYFVSPNQINAQVPWNVLPSNSGIGTVSIVVTTTGGASAPQSVAIVQAMPGIFTANANGLGQAIATDSLDNLLSAPTVATAGVTGHPIRIGEYLVVWCTGLGAVDAPVNSGDNTGGRIVHTLITPAVLIGGVKATPVYSILTPQYVGEYQVAVQVAPGTPTGLSVPLQIEVNGVTASNSAAVTVASAYGAPLDTSCTLTSGGCTPINLMTADQFSTTGAFAGYVDPSIRQDPQTGTLWIAYSWPHTIPGPSAQVLDTHVSYSTDGGRTWTYKGALYTSKPVLNPVTGQTDYTSHEVMNLLPQVVNGVTYWYGIHSTYNVPRSESYSKRWEIAMARGDASTGPMGLVSAAPQYLGQSINTYPQYFPVALNLSSLSSEVSACNEFFEPALVISNNNLYLFLSCQPIGSPATFYAVFKTSNPQENAPNWKWTYVAQGSTKFANRSDAASVSRYLGPGATYITQMDIAPGKQPGTMLAIATAAYDNSNGKISLGCLAADLASIDPPRFIHDSQGQVQVDAFIASPDSQSTGPGSCTYSPFADTGLIMAHRQTSNAPQDHGWFSLLMQSFLFP